jgi:RNA polymerase sigma-70 factor (ECF subfamily)
VATLARILGDIDRAEDAIQEAFTIAASRWPRDGLPTRPLAWIITTARNRAIDTIRSERTRTGSEAARLRILEGTTSDDLDSLSTDAPIPDERLGLVFACCHPSLALEAQVPLTLRLVAGLTVPQIGRALLLPEATVAQRLVRAKRKIRDAVIPIAEPPADQLPSRIQGVLAVLYLTYSEGYSATGGTELRRDDLAAEAIRLTEVLRALMPDEAEPTALLALMTLHHARRRARSDAGGALVLLAEQDRSLWDGAAIARGVALVERALRMRRSPGPYALQSAIAALHAEASRAEDTDWPQIVALYDTLVRVAPTPVIALNRAVAVAMVDGPQEGLAAIDALTAAGALDDYGPLHAARADMLRRLGRRQEAAEAYQRGVELIANPTERSFLTGRRDAMRV